MEREQRRVSDLFSTVTIGILFVAILLLVVFSAVTYRQCTDAQKRSNDTRAVVSYVATAVKDSTGAKIKPEEFDGCPGLLIAAPGGEFEWRIYAKDGSLLEEYGVKDEKINPEEARVIGEVSEFTAQYIDEDLLEIRTDRGTSYVRTGDR